MTHATITKPRLQKAIDRRRAWPVQQFGQADDVSTFAGRTGCTHTVLQALIDIWRGLRPSHDSISRTARYPWPSANPRARGLTPAEVVRVLAAYRLPYTIASGAEIETVLRASNRAPVIYGIRYGDYPRSDDLPPGRAQPPYAEQHGATQRTGFDGAHACLLLGYELHTVKPQHYDAFSMEPNHNSGRAETPRRPAYDVITTIQLKRAFEAITTTGWSRTYAFLPTRELPT